MSETRMTMTIAAVAFVLVVLAFATAPGKMTPDAFLDRGESFFPEFTDPNSATTLEVIEFDEETATARPFKVTFQEGRWTIPSHHDYPADGKDRLAQTAAGVIGINKDDFRSNNVADHEACGVVDPLDETLTTLKGRGKRVTIRGESDQVLADLIIGRKLEERENQRFVRIPGQKRIYVSRIDIDISTRFEDWIEKDLLTVEKERIRELTLQDYSINERTGRIVERDVLNLTKSDGVWKADKMTPSQEIDTTKMDALLTAVDELSIVGVRLKPPGLSSSLRRGEDVAISQADMLSLQSKGYYFTRDGSLVSNEGEMEIRTDEGIVYTLRFGEILYGTGDAITAGGEGGGDTPSGPGENRYLFVSASFDDSVLPEPRQPANRDFEGKAEDDWTDQDRRNKDLADAYDRWQEDVAKGKELSAELNSRFADWYYVISSASFDKMRVKRSEIVKKKDS